jgi:hypothetical protein
MRRAAAEEGVHGLVGCPGATGYGPRTGPARRPAPKSSSSVVAARLLWPHRRPIASGGLYTFSLFSAVSLCCIEPRPPLTAHAARSLDPPLTAQRTMLLAQPRCAAPARRVQRVQRAMLGRSLTRIARPGAARGLGANVFVASRRWATNAVDTRVDQPAPAAAVEESGDSKSSAYPFAAIEAKWQEHWEKHQTFRTPEEIDTSKPKYYVLDMFPYPRCAPQQGTGHPPARPAPRRPHVRAARCAAVSVPRPSYSQAAIAPCMRRAQRRRRLAGTRAPRSGCGSTLSRALPHPSPPPPPSRC